LLRDKLAKIALAKKKNFYDSFFFSQIPEKNCQKNSIFRIHGKIKINIIYSAIRQINSTKFD
jgi:hypothetical protein